MVLAVEGGEKEGKMEEVEGGREDREIRKQWERNCTGGQTWILLKTLSCTFILRTELSLLLVSCSLLWPTPFP